MADSAQTHTRLRSLIGESLGEQRLHEIRLTDHRDHAGEPAVSIGVTMKAAEDIPDARRQSELTHQLVEALAALGQDRFPYLYFDALDMDQSPDDADDFDSSPELSERH